MKTLLAAACLLTATAASVSANLAPKEVQPKVIYGDDDRLDLYQVKDARVLSLADSTVGLFEGSGVAVSGGRASLSTQSYGQAYGLCKEEPFFEQVLGAFCSGSLVAPDVIMTAGHCVTSAERCKDVKFVFGFGIKSEGANPASVPADDVYGCAALLGREQINNGQDWALIKLDRPVSGHAPLKVNLEKAVVDGEPLFVIGHPAGLPTKVAGGATVRAANPVERTPEGQEIPLKGFFRANLDTYGGNSGSAVFSARTGLVEGILVRGETDYYYTDKGCRLSYRCAADACRGEDVTKASAVPLGGPFAPPAAGAPAAARVMAVGKDFAALLRQAESLTAQ
jgi:V8-like Glu-specific endopeptidase